jgi:fructokinase
MRIVSVGEILWDVIGQSEHLGGAPLNFAAHAQKLGHEVFPLSAVGDDERGHRTLDLLRQRGMSTEFVTVLADQPTGTAEVELDMEGKPTFRIVRPAAYDFVELSSAELQRVQKLQPDWIYFGTLYHVAEHALASTRKVLQAAPAARRFYDVNLREGNWTLTAVEQLSLHATVVKLSDSEAEGLDANMNSDADENPIEGFCRRWIDRFQCQIMCVTCGERGCAILKNKLFTQVPGFHVEVADTVGAGDAFSAAFVHGLEQGWDVPRIGRFANAVGATVASRAGAIPDWSLDEAWARIGQRYDTNQPVGQHPVP